MRVVIWDTMMIIHGSFNPSTQKQWVKETKRLESICRKSKEEFEQQIEIIKLDKGMNHE